MKTEAQLQAYFRSAARKTGVLWRKIKFEGQRGCPDVLIAHEGQVVLVELKSPSRTGRLSPLQRRQVTKLKRAGMTVHVVDNKEQVDDIISKITGGAVGDDSG